MRIYPSKLLLFGEHVLLLGSSALAVPVHLFCGKWSENGDTVVVWREKLQEFASSAALRKVEGLRAGDFERELAEGLAFDSNIPVGYGLGSSGALCAAVYDRYVDRKTEDLAALKAIFAQMESFFHGSSSGIDPLTSYVNAPLLIRRKTEVLKIQAPVWEQDKPQVFLLDTRLPRQTGPLVRWFLEQQQLPGFAEMLQERYLPEHEAMVQAWLSSDSANFWRHLHLVSALQLGCFGPLVPGTFRNFWEHCLGSGDVVPKICGAGGGGFLLLFSRSIAAAAPFTESYPVQKLDE